MTTNRCDPDVKKLYALSMSCTASIENFMNDLHRRLSNDRSNPSPCTVFSAERASALNLLLNAIGLHRHVHGEMPWPIDLSKNPDRLLEAVTDGVGLMTGMLKLADPGHDYIVSIVKVEAKP